MPDPSGPERFALIAVNRPVFGQFHYRVPAPLEEAVRIGSRVRVPFGHGRASGVCVGFDEGPPPVTAEQVKSIASVVDSEPLFTEETLRLAVWMSRYYLCPLGEVLATFLPGGVERAQRAVRRVSVDPERGDASAEAASLERRAPRQAALLRHLLDTGDIPLDVLRAGSAFSASAYRALLEKGWLRVSRGPAADPEPPPGDGEPGCGGPPPALTEDQSAAVEAVRAAEGFAPLLLHGVTGSGKTEVYLRAMADRIARGEQAIVLVPEIALTPQTVDRVRARFRRVAVLHSRLSDRDRARSWLAIRQGAIDVTIGARSAVFAPAPRLGIIVVDEEHESTFKQQNNPRYQARDLAVKRAQMLDIPVILGSATPSVESYQNALAGRYRLVRLPERVTGQPLPEVEVVDLAKDSASRRKLSLIGRTLEAALHDVLGRGEQAMLFLNRRGFHTVCICDLCGTPLRCPQCDLTLTFHKARGRLLCHSCTHAMAPPSRCPECGDDQGLRFFGLGTERIEEHLRARLPGARVARMDSDTMTRPEAYREVLDAFRARKLDILVGTQMIAKGLDFPGVTLVGVVSADTALALPDFRAAERTFQLLTQVAGRAGRGRVPGRVIVQSLDTGHYAVVTACRQDYEAFARRELRSREAFGLPPFRRVMRLLFTARDENRLRKTGRAAAEILSAVAEDEGLEVLGPVPTPVYKLRGEFRYHALVKAGQPEGLRHAFKALEAGPRGWRSGVQMHVDVDPLGLA